MTDNALDVATVEAPEVTAAAQQIFLGKLASAGENGQVSIFTLPDELKWLDCFTAGELVEFFTEVLIELERALASGDLSEVVSELEAWKAQPRLTLMRIWLRALRPAGEKLKMVK